jgi:hypothetical protein
LLILNGVGVLLGWRFLNGSLGEWGGDNVHFLLLAEALKGGYGYVDLHLPGFPPHLNYPPVYPILLVPWLALGAPLVWIKGFTALLGLAGLNVCYVILRRWQGDVSALLVCIATLCCGAFLDPGLSIMSESPFLLFSSLTILFVQRTIEGTRRTSVLGIEAGLLMGLTVLTRSIGVTLAPAAILLATFPSASPAPLRERLRRLVTVGVAAAILAGPWFARGTTVEMPGTASYLQEFRQSDTILEKIRSRTVDTPNQRSMAGKIAARPLDNLWDFATRLARTAMPERIRGMGEFWTAAILYGFLALCAVLSGITLVGLVRGLWIHRRAHDFYVLSYLTLLAFWIGGGFRLLMPILPFLFGYVYEGGCWLGRVLRRPQRLGRFLLVLTILANLGVTTQFPLIRERLAGRYAAWWSDLIRASCRLAEQAAPGERVIAAPDNVVFFFSGLQAERLPVRGRTEMLLARMLESRAGYVVITPFEQWRFKKIARIVEEYSESFPPVFTEGEVRVLRIERGGDVGTLAPDEPVRPVVPPERCDNISP